MGLEWIQLILSLCGIIGLFFFMLYFLKKLSKGAALSGGRRLKVVDRLNLGRDSMVVVVSVCEKLMLIAVSTGRIEKICDLELTQEEYLCAADSNPAKATAFSDILSGISKQITKKPFGEHSGSTGQDDGKAADTERHGN